MKWIDPSNKPAKDYLSSAYKGSLILPVELEKRNIKTLQASEAFLKPSAYQQTSPFSFIEMEKTIDRILDAIQKQEIIGIWGDFDADGQTSTAVLLETLLKLGAQNTIFHIPNRLIESHGIQISAFRSFLSQGPSLVITCDTGISAHESIAFAKSKSVDVIITDHHILPEKLPDAYSIINPHQLQTGHPLSFLAGVGTVYQVVRALNSKLNNRLNIGYLYDLVALGTIADLAQLKKENRLYAQKGLLEMNRNLRTCFKAMFEVSQTKINLITENTIGFNIAPRLNSSGRLSDANENVKFLLSKDKLFCKKFAESLEDLNNQRKLAVDNTFHSALEMLSRAPSLMQDSVIILQREGWNTGVLGIVAGKLTELYNRPVVLLNQDGNILSGSARSVEGINIIKAISESKKLLIRFGGHSMAAGMSLLTDNFSNFSFNLKKSIGPSPAKLLHIDHYISFASIGKQLVDELALLAPFGKGNESPVFASINNTLIEKKKFGGNKQHMRYIVRDASGDTSEIIEWNSNGESFQGDRFDIAYHIQPNEYHGNKSVFLEYVDHREYHPASITFDTFIYPVNFEDYRCTPNPINKLHDILKYSKNQQIWYEGIKKPKNIIFNDRLHLKQTENLFILTSPPSFQVLQKIIAASQADKIFLFAYNLPQDNLKTFIANLGGILKFYLNTVQTPPNLLTLAANLCYTQKTILLGLSWLQAHGDIYYQLLDDGQIKIEKTSHAPINRLKSIQKKLIASLKEIEAFREYYMRAKPELLLRINGQ
ncbi:MAG: single-stranded-DNA-specific exonuclease RecJ [Anaerolineaceae bacterium]|nr:single-stranded-DNA-specific exonuclease RecJ [Anaerolineaceae bacterium]